MHADVSVSTTLVRQDEELAHRHRQSTFHGLQGIIAASYTGLDQQDDAEREIEQILVIDPGYTASKYESMARMANRDEFNRFLEDLRKAGLPD